MESNNIAVVKIENSNDYELYEPGIVSAVKDEPIDIETNYSNSDTETNKSDHPPAVHPTRSLPQKKMYECYLCKTLTQLSILRKHMEIHIGEPYKPFACSVCGFRFKRNDKLQEHIRIHTGERPFVCDICSRSFRLKASMLIHKRIHDNNEAFHCDHCSRIFKSKSGIKKHMVKHSTANKPRKPRTPAIRPGLACQYCEKRFNTKTQVTTHENQLHTNERPFQCCHCPKRFVSIGILNAHEKTHTLTTAERAKFECKYCGKKFIKNATLVIHIRTHTGEKPYECTECGKSFSTKALLKEHKKTHTGEKPYACGFCPQRYTNLSNMREHQRIHTGEMPFECPFCQKRFRAAGSLWKHKKRMHNGKELGSSAYPSARPTKKKKKKKKQAKEKSEAIDTVVVPDIKVKSPSPLLEFYDEIPKLIEEVQPIERIYAVPETQPNKSSTKCDRCSSRFETVWKMLDHRKIHDTLETPIPKTSVNNIEIHFIETVDTKSELPLEEMVSEISLDHVWITKDDPVNDPIGSDSNEISCEPNQTKSDAVENVEIQSLKQRDNNKSLENYENIPKTTETLECDHCKQIFTRKFDLIKHIKTHSKGPLQCSHCPKQFNKWHKLELHKKHHTNDKPYQCCYCAKSFVSIGFLNAHEKVHRDGIVKKFECDLCDKKFDRRAKLIDHYCMHTGEKRFMCSTCGKKFRRRCGLKEHETLHTGEKPFSCTYCPQKYRCRANLAEHIRIHTGELPFACPFCVKKFREASGLWKHKKKMHSNQTK